MDKRDFVPLAADPQKLSNTDSRPISSKERVIKKHRVEHLDVIHDYHPGPITHQPDEPEIIVEEKDGQVVRIHFQCRCGCKTTVDFVYEE